MHYLLIRGGRIADGTGALAFTGDVAVKVGKIVEVGKAAGGAKRVVDADGLKVAPGSYLVGKDCKLTNRTQKDNLMAPSCCPWRSS